MLQDLQDTEPKYVLLKSKLISGVEDKNFQLVNKILYKTEMVFDQMSYKLCLPSFIAQDILTNEHLRNNNHMSIKPLTDRFNALFYVPDVHKKAAKVIEACLSCLLASTSYKKKISGTSRTHEDDTTVGKNYVADIAYLPPSRRGNRFCLVLVERLTSFISAIPLKSLTAESAANALRLFIGIIGYTMGNLSTDFGAEFSTAFTRQLNAHQSVCRPVDTQRLGPMSTTGYNQYQSVTS